MKREHICPLCRHLKSAHAVGRCNRQRSVPGGRVYPCDCDQSFVTKFTFTDVAVTLNGVRVGHIKEFTYDGPMMSVGEVLAAGFDTSPQVTVAEGTIVTKPPPGIRGLAIDVGLVDDQVVTTPAPKKRSRK